MWWVKWQNWVIVRQCTRSSIEIQLPSRIIVGSPGTKLPDISSKEKEGEGPCKSSVRNSWYKRQVRLTQTYYGTFFISLFVYLSMTDTQKWKVWKIWKKKYPMRKKSTIPSNIVHQKQWHRRNIFFIIFFLFYNRYNWWKINFDIFVQPLNWTIQNGSKFKNSIFVISTFPSIRKKNMNLLWEILYLKKWKNEVKFL